MITFIENHEELKFSAMIRKGEKQYLATCPEINVTSQGKTVEESIANLKEAVELYGEVMGFEGLLLENEPIYTKISIRVPRKRNLLVENKEKG